MRSEFARSIPQAACAYDKETLWICAQYCFAILPVHTLDRRCDMYLM